MLQRNRSYRFRLTLIGYAFSCDIGPWKSDLLPYLLYTVGNLHYLFLVGGAHIDLPTDSLTFLLIIYLALRSNVWQFQTPSLFRTIIQDATYYFLVIFTSHLLLEMTLLFANVRISSQFSIFFLWPAETFVAYTTTSPRRVSDARTVAFLCSPDRSPRNSGNVVYVRISLCFLNRKV